MAAVEKTVVIQGTRALIFHRFNVDVITQPTRKEKTGSAGNNPEEWRTSFFMTDDRQLYLPRDYFFACIKGGAKYVKVGRGSIAPALTATLQVMTDKVLLDRYMPENWEKIETKDFTTNESSPVYLDIRAVINPNTKSRNVRYRIACAEKWTCAFDVKFDSSIVSVKNVEQAITDAGALVGLADGRPMGYGRFELLAFDDK